MLNAISIAPLDFLIPVLDILRLASRHSQVYQLLVKDSKYLDLLLGLLNSSVPNAMLIYRTMAHFVAHYSVHDRIMDYREALLGMSVAALADSNSTFSKHSQWKNVQIAIATLILNFAVLLFNCQNIATIEAKGNLLSTIVTIISKVQEEEALFRILSAAGTLLTDEESIALAKSLELASQIEHLRGVPGKVGECVKQVLGKL